MTMLPATTNLYPGMEPRPAARPIPGTERIPGSAAMFPEVMAAKAVTPTEESDPLVCDVCGKKCGSTLGLNSHKRSHK